MRILSAARRFPLAALCVAIGLGAACASAKSTLYNQAMKKQRRDAGLSSGTVRVLDHNMPFIERGEGPTVLFLHGFAANKDTWIGPFLDGFADRFHVVLPDLPGFGDATFRAGASYTAERQVERLVAFMDAQDIARAHVVGNSMGGYLALALAAAAPDRVQSLSLLAPAGIQSEEDTPFQIRVKAGGENTLIVEDRAGLEAMLDLVFVNRPDVPDLALDVLTGEFAQRAKQHHAIWDQLAATKFDASPYVAQVKAPTLIVWGDSDRVLHPSGAAPLAAAIAGSTAVVLKDCGHMPQLEKPNRTASELLKFMLDLEEAQPAAPTAGDKAALMR